MKTRKLLLSFRLIVALALIVGILFGSIDRSINASADSIKESKAKKLTEEQRIIHVLNRLGFGARPGDVERVKAIGIENYISQQLNPEKISDTVAENKVKDLSVLTMTTAELYEKFPQPGQLLRQLQARGVLPSDLAEERENRVKCGANAAPVQ